MTPQRRESHRARLTLRRDQMRNLLEELSDLERDLAAAGVGAGNTDDAKHAARRLFTELGAMRDLLGRARRGDDPYIEVRP